VDGIGLDRLDRLYLTTIAENYKGGPVGIDALAATVNEEVQTLADVVEPYLLKMGFVLRTPGGRKIGEAALSKLRLLDLKEQGRLL
jgi:Holliday junction DNA helicase RuvB